MLTSASKHSAPDILKRLIGSFLTSSSTETKESITQSVGEMLQQQRVVDALHEERRGEAGLSQGELQFSVKLSE